VSGLAAPQKNPPLKNAILISNPLAGISIARRPHQISRVCAVLQNGGIEATVKFTSGVGHAQQLAREAVNQSCDLIIVCGGDGTINEVINGMADSHVPLAVLPCGTANIVARELCLPRRMQDAARQLASWQRYRLPLGRATWQESGLTRQRYFIAVAGVGFDASVIRRLDLNMKLRLGVVAYAWEAVRQVLRYDFPAFECTVNGAKISATFAVIQRSSRYAGWLQLARPHSIGKPDFSCCFFGSTSRSRYFRYALGVLTHTHHRLQDVKLICGPAVHCTNERTESTVYFEVDGEIAGQIPASFEVVPDALTLLAPRTFVDRQSGGHHF